MDDGLNPLQKFLLAISVVGGIFLLGMPLLVGIGWLLNFLGFIGTQPTTVQAAVPSGVPWFVPLLCIVLPGAGLWYLFRGANEVADILSPLRLGRAHYEANIKYSERHAVLGYKWLELRSHGKLHSPLYGSEWIGYKLRSSGTPTLENTVGIYFTTSPDDEALEGYEAKDALLCEIEFYDQIVFHERITKNNGEGGRAESGEIVRIIKKGRKDRLL